MDPNFKLDNKLLQLLSQVSFSWGSRLQRSRWHMLFRTSIKPSVFGSVRLPKHAYTWCKMQLHDFQLVLHWLPIHFRVHFKSPFFLHLLVVLPHQISQICFNLICRHACSSLQTSFFWQRLKRWKLRENRAFPVVAPNCRLNRHCTSDCSQIYTND